MDVSGQIVVVTGASRGLGDALCKRLKSLGATVVGCSLHGEPARDIQSVDVCNAKDVDAFLKKVIQQHGRIDILINNAGYAGTQTAPEDVSDEEYEKQMRTNVDGVFYFLRGVLPLMKKQGAGTILNVGSRAGVRAHPGFTVYSAAKAAVRSMTQAVARGLNEEGSSVRCIVVSPGGIDTDLREKLFGAEDSRKQQSPDRVAELITQIFTGEVTVQSGADVGIAKGEITSVVEID